MVTARFRTVNHAANRNQWVLTLGGLLLQSTDTSLPMRLDVQPLKRVFGLTDTEADLVEAVSQGLTNSQIAERRGRATATINAQVKSILSKTRCRTRAQFVARALSLCTIAAHD